jgi:CubicO group peptidase (beta-lactamase class C family)
MLIMKKIAAEIFLVFCIIFSINSSAYTYDFTEVDNIIDNAISNRYFPGAQLLIANQNEILYSRSYGYYTYDQTKAVTENSIFDLASLTKVIATTAAIMKLYDEGKVGLDHRVAYYIPEFAANGKEWITVENLLLHNSGLKAWMPFYTTCYNKQDVINTICSEGLSYSTGTNFKYSDLNAIMLGVLVERITGMALDVYCEKEIFEPLGMKSTYFTPDEFQKELSLPTEYDGSWRGRMLQGEVHDEAASVMGGVSGNAGLFSNAEDIYRMVKVMLNGGIFTNPNTAGLKLDTFVTSETIERFLTRPMGTYYYNTRALGWDTKPEPTSYRQPCGEMISDNCFGHTGYTGTSVWADRDRKLVVILLTNRVHPSRTANGIRDVRPEVHNKAIEIYSNQ